MPKESIKDKLDGNELDLSLGDLTTVPVKELAGLTRATHIDLSCNLLISLPMEFCSLTHIVRLDLSKNKLTELPAKFGSLVRLQHVDLLGNQLTTLPVSMSRLPNLRWMDVKDNPLDENLKKVVGDCLDEMQCRQSAKNIVAYMKTVSSDIDRERQKQLKQKRELDSIRKAEDEKAKQRQKEERKAEREQRKREYEATQVEKKRREATLKEKKEKDSESSSTNGVKASQQKAKDSGGISCCGLLIAFMVAIIAAGIGFYFFCEHRKEVTLCHDVKMHLETYYNLARKNLDQYLKPTKT